MKLSIIIPTYNSASVLSKALDSIVCQTFTDWEILIMDGVSTDNTLKVAESYHAPRIRIYSEPDKGIYDAMNKGIKKAKGEWLYFLGSDDYFFSKDVLASVFNQYLDGVDVLYGDAIAPHLDKRHSGKWSIETLPYNRCHQAIFYKKKIFKKTGFYNLRYPVLADYALNLQWFLRRDINERYIPVCIATFSSGGYSTTHYDNAFYKDHKKILFRYGFWRFNINQKIELVSDLYDQKTNFFCKVFYYLLHKWLISYRLLFYCFKRIIHD